VFGRDRKVDFPQYFFCHGCDLLEDAVWNGNTRASRKQNRYLCTGGHDNAAHPSTLKPQYCPSALAFASSDKPPTKTSSDKSPTKSPVKKKIRRVPVTVNDEDIASLSQGLHELASPRQLFKSKGHDDDKTLDDTSVINGSMIDGATNEDGSHTSSNGFDSLESEWPKNDLVLENSLLKTRLQELTMEVNVLKAEIASLKQQVPNLSAQFDQDGDEEKSK
jgi:hypothetical protein